MDFPIDIGALNHDKLYRASVAALEEGLRRDDVGLDKERSCYLIALTNATLALYLLFVTAKQEV